jgi:hypothetical protein
MATPATILFLSPFLHLPPWRWNDKGQQESFSALESFPYRTWHSMAELSRGKNFPVIHGTTYTSWDFSFVWSWFEFPLEKPRSDSFLAVFCVNFIMLLLDFTQPRSWYN